MENEVRVVNGYMQDTDGKWILTEETKAAAKAAYYAGRIAYDPQNPSHAIGKYTPTGEVVPFASWATPMVPLSTKEG